MIEKQFNGVHWQEFELLADLPIIHGCMKRHGGVSSGLLSSLNLGKSVGDDPQNVFANYKKVAEALSLPKILSAKLSHGAAITTITAKNQIFPISDALTTAIPYLAIAVTHADCQAALFYDPILHVLANVHCGWRGSVQNIYEATVKTMQAVHGSHPSNLLVCISPSLGPNHAEFIHYQKELPESFWEFKSEGSCFNFWEISRTQLEKAGVLPHHIQIAEIDTYSHPDYFSHRHTTHLGLEPVFKLKRSLESRDFDAIQRPLEFENRLLGLCGRQATICALR